MDFHSGREILLQQPARRGELRSLCDLIDVACRLGLIRLYRAAGSTHFNISAPGAGADASAWKWTSTLSLCRGRRDLLLLTFLVPLPPPCFLSLRPGRLECQCAGAGDQPTAKARTNIILIFGVLDGSIVRSAVRSLDVGAPAAPADDASPRLVFIQIQNIS